MGVPHACTTPGVSFETGNRTHTPCTRANQRAASRSPSRPLVRHAIAIDAGPIESFCQAGTSALGCVATLVAAGVPSASATAGFTLSANGVDGVRQGLVFYGLNGRAALPWGTGSSFLCVKSPTQRTGVQLSGGTSGTCSGQLSLDFLQFVATNPAALGAPLQAGATVQAQAWYRDPPAPKSTSLSNALEFLVQP